MAGMFLFRLGDRGPRSKRICEAKFNCRSVGGGAKHPSGLLVNVHPQLVSRDDIVDSFRCSTTLRALAITTS